MSRRRIVLFAIAGAAISGALVTALVLNGPGHVDLTANARHAHRTHRSQSGGHLLFSTLNNSNDPAFNQLLGLNNRGVIVGYFGSGAQDHPNKGYLLILSRHGSRYQNENFPGSAQTQVTGLNDQGVTVGFWSAMNNSQAGGNAGFYAVRGRFHSVSFPAARNASPPVNQLLGVNDRDVAVGFYTDAGGNNHGYSFDIVSHRFHSIKIEGARSVTAAGIDNQGDVAGFFTGSGGVTRAFLLHRSRVSKLAYPGAAMTQALGVNDSREVVGVYQTGSGGKAKLHGFTWTSRRGFTRLDDPRGPGATTINGVNDAGDLVGFYTDAAGSTHGLLFAQGQREAPPAPPVPDPPVMPARAAAPGPSMMPATSAAQAPSGMPPSPGSAAPAPAPTPPQTPAPTPPQTPAPTPAQTTPAPSAPVSSPPQAQPAPTHW